MTELTSPRTIDEQREIAATVLQTNKEVAKNPEMLDREIADFLDQSDSLGMAKLLPHRLVWSDEATNHFFSDEKSKPYEKFSFSNDKETKKMQYAEIGNYLRMQYEEAKKKDSPDLDTKRANLHKFIHRTTMELFVDEYIANNNNFNGVDTKSIHDGNPTLTSEYQDLLHRSAQEVDEHNAEVLVQRVITATAGGDLQSLITFLEEYKGQEDVRQVVESVIQKRVNDPKIAEEKLRLAFEVAQYRMMFGVDLELMYEVGRSPRSSIREEIYQTSLNHAKENIESHLKDNTPQSFNNYKQNGYLNPMDAYRETAVHDEKADSITPHTTEEINTIFQEVTNHLTILESNPLDGIFFVDAPGMRARSSDISYYNKNGDLVRVVYMNKKLPDEKLKSILGHEIVQSIHADLVKNAHQTAIDDVDSTHREDVSATIERQFDRKRKRDEGIPKHLRAQHQAHYALMQNKYRQKIDQLIKSGVQSLEDTHIHSVLEEMNMYLQENVLRRGLPLINTMAGIASTLEPLKDYDGGRYVQETPSGKSELESAMETRFGDEFWLDNQEARTVFYYASAQMADSWEERTITEIVLHTDPDFALEGLTYWGYEPEMV